MHTFPHQYLAVASGAPEGSVMVATPGVETLETAAPTQFDGPGDRWSPETMLVAAAADCFILTFRAIAAASRLEWTLLRCGAEGKLDRIDGVTRFTALALRAELEVPAETDLAKAEKILEKAERSCLIARSLALKVTLTCAVRTTPFDAVEGVVENEELESLSAPV